MIPGGHLVLLAPSNDVEPEEEIYCWHPGCYLSVDLDTGECDYHGLPTEEVE